MRALLPWLLPCAALVFPLSPRLPATAVRHHAPLLSASDEIAKLQSTLEGLRADGFPAEVLAPLQSQIRELELKAGMEKLQTTLQNLRDDGMPPEALAPLENQIAGMEAIIAANREEAPPEITDAQRRVFARWVDGQHEVGRAQRPREQVERKLFVQHPDIAIDV